MGVGSAARCVWGRSRPLMWKACADSSAGLVCACGAHFPSRAEDGAGGAELVLSWWCSWWC